MVTLREKWLSKILCIDSASMIRALMETILTNDGLDVITASNGLEGLNLMSSAKPDAVLLDLDMPNSEGLAILEHVMQHGELSVIPVVVVTIMNDQENVQRALALGAHDYILKPFQPHSLRERVRKVLHLVGHPDSVAASNPVYVQAASAPETRLVPKVLVADNRPAILSLAHHLLADQSDVHTASSAAALLSLAAKERPEVILMDLSLPGMGVPELVERLRRTPGLSHTRLVAMLVTSDREQPFLPLFDGHVAMPLQRDEVTQKIVQLTGQCGLFSFRIRGLVTVLRLHQTELWGNADLRCLYRNVELALAQMLETGYSWFLIDLTDLIGLAEEQMTVVLGVLRNIVARVGACKLDCKVVVPSALEPYCEQLREKYQVDIHQLVHEAVRSYELEAERQFDRSGNASAPLRRPGSAQFG